MHLLFRNISERLSPPCESFVALRLPPFAAFEFGVGMGIHNEFSSALVFEAVASAPVAAAALAAAAGTLLFVAVLLLLLFSLKTVGGRRVSGTIFWKRHDRKKKSNRNSGAQADSTYWNGKSGADKC